MWCMISWVSKKREVSTCFPKSDYWRSQSDEENTCLFIVVCSSWSKSLKSTILKTESIILVKLPIVCSALYWVDGIWDRILVGCGRRSGCGSCTCCCMPCLAVTISWIVDDIIDDVGISLYGWWLFLLHVRRLPWLELMLGEDWKAKTENSVIGGILWWCVTIGSIQKVCALSVAIPDRSYTFKASSDGKCMQCWLAVLVPSVELVQSQLRHNECGRFKKVAVGTCSTPIT